MLGNAPARTCVLTAPKFMGPAHSRRRSQVASREDLYASDELRRAAEDTIADATASGLWPGKVATTRRESESVSMGLREAGA
jgi:hypothetical protein